MYQRLGICWHTGYMPPPYKKPDTDVPAIKRMKQWLREKGESSESR